MSTVPDEFDLRALVRQVATETSLRGPEEITAKVVEMVPDKHLRAALLLTLPDTVRRVLFQDRQPVERYARQTEKQTAGNVNSARSSMSKRIREGWRRTLAGQFHIGHGQWKVLGECTYDEVMFLSAERQAHAEANAAAAAMFARLAAAMKRRKATTAGDLPEKVLVELLTSPEVAA